MLTIESYLEIIIKHTGIQVIVEVLPGIINTTVTSIPVIVRIFIM